MKDKKRVICIEDSIDGLTKDKVYEINQSEARELYYGLIDDNGLYCRCRANNFINTKQVVINGDDSRVTCVPSLTPYWTVELFKRKGKEFYVYEWDCEDGDSFYNLIDTNNAIDLNKKYYVLYSKNKIEKTIYDNDDSIEEYELISEYSLFKEISREDKDLIDIVKEINNDKIIKVVDIPIDVDYYIEEGQCGFAETICENHRKWS